MSTRVRPSLRTNLNDTTRVLDEKRELALAILLWRYIGHGFSKGGGITNEIMERAELALEMAKKVGVKDEYLKIMMEIPLQSVRIRSLGE